MIGGPAYQVLWAKTNKEGKVHPLICHMIDVAQVALAMWEHCLTDSIREQMSQTLGLKPGPAGRLIAFWAGLHDLGKASPAFALVKSEVGARAVRAALPRPSIIPSDVPHGVLTAKVAEPFLREFGLAPSAAQTCATVVGGHHGRFPANHELQSVAQPALGGNAWDAARRQLVSALADALGVQSDGIPIQMDVAVSMYLAGLVSVADWIGSNDDFFAYVWHNAQQAGTPIDLAAYRLHARDKAAEALGRLGWVDAPLATSPTTFAALFPKIEGPPRPVQQAIMDLAPRLDGPSLVLVEAPMGEGKTEAAMYLADYWGAAGGRQGCYFALPTQATSNQMFGRVVEFLGNRFPDATINTQLMHGHASLSAQFEELRRNAGRLFEPKDMNEDQKGPSGRVVAAEWFTYRKRGLLAPFGVGTVDQALLAVLKTWHVFVRLFGLANKTVIIDEVHAYDTYMSALIERLLQWLAALGSSVVLLSATLPKARSAALLTAYAKGLDPEQPREAGISVRYPRVTWITKGSGGGVHVATSSQMARDLTIRWVDGAVGDGTDLALGQQLRAALANGGCAAVICNTVRRAQEVYDALKPYYPGDADDGQPRLDLLHARYLFEERDRREKRALARFGKPGGEIAADDGRRIVVRRPDRTVLVATQVIEQSLDLDFDLMVSDLAPADLLLQRSGRLWRHQRTRPAGISGPELWVARPGVGDDGVPRFQPGDDRVYDPHVLLRSWLALRDKGVVGVPEDIEELIESVYDERACPDGVSQALRACWEETRRRHEGEEEAERQEARDRWLKSPNYSGALWRMTEDPREEDTPEFHRAHQALTRLSEPTVEVVCLFGSVDRPFLDEALTEPVNLTERPSADLSRRLLLRSVGVAHWGVVYDLLAKEAPSGWRHSPLLRRHRLVTLDAARCAPVGRYQLHLDDELGLVVAQP